MVCDVTLVSVDARNGILIKELSRRADRIRSIPQQGPNEKKHVSHINPTVIFVYLRCNFRSVSRLFLYIMQ